MIYEIEKADEGGDQVQVCFGSGQARYNAFATVNVPPAYLLGTPQRAMADFIDAIRADAPALAGLHRRDALPGSPRRRRTLSLPPGMGEPAAGRLSRRSSVISGLRSAQWLSAGALMAKLN